MVQFLAVAGGAVVLDLARAYVIPYKTCPVCHGRGQCTRCQYTGKVLRFGARWVHPELTRRKQ